MATNTSQDTQAPRRTGELGDERRASDTLLRLSRADASEIIQAEMNSKLGLALLDRIDDGRVYVVREKREHIKPAQVIEDGQVATNTHVFRTTIRIALLDELQNPEVGDFVLNVDGDNARLYTDGSLRRSPQTDDLFQARGWLWERVE